MVSSMGNERPHDRIAELEAENERLRDELEQVLRQQEADRTSIQAAITVLQMRTDGIG
jgi:hypothetical protein